MAAFTTGTRIIQATAKPWGTSFIEDTVIYLVRKTMPISLYVPKRQPDAVLAGGSDIYCTQITDLSGNGFNANQEELSLCARFGDGHLVFSGGQYYDTDVIESLHIDGDLTLLLGTENGSGYVFGCGAPGESLTTNVLYRIAADNYIHEYSVGYNETVAIPFMPSVLVRDASEKTIRIDGEMTYSYTNAPAKASSGNVQFLRIGAGPTNVLNDYEGIFKYLAIYNRILTDVEVSEVVSLLER
jgi:hypothetical protein